MSIFGRLSRRKPADPADQLVEWLANKNLDDRRVIVSILYGGPFSLKVCKWVLSQPDCDVGTASLLLWEFGLPDALVNGPDRFPVSDEVKRELIAFIVKRWRAGHLPPAVFEWDPRHRTKLYRRALKKKGLQGQNPFMIPDEAWQPIKGRQPARSPATVIRPGSPLDAIMPALRLADLAAINPKDWDPVRRKTPGPE